MELIISLFLMLISLGVLIKASDWFVAGAEHIGLVLNIPQSIIGVTIVAFGTSLPELASSIVAVNEGAPDVVAGNAIGSNIANLLLVMGLMSLTHKYVAIEKELFEQDMPMLIVSAFLLYLFINDGELSFTEAIFFLLALTVYLVTSLQKRSREIHRSEKIKGLDLVKVIGGAALVYIGATFTIRYLIDSATILGIDTGIIAVTLIALGTSLPEIVVSITAAKKGNPSMALGNVFGSNIFNTYAVMAIPSFFGELVFPDDLLGFSLPFMCGVTLLSFFLLFKRSLTRSTGIILLLMYIYFIYQVIQNNITT